VKLKNEQYQKLPWEIDTKLSKIIVSGFAHSKTGFNITGIGYWFKRTTS